MEKTVLKETDANDIKRMLSEFCQFELVFRDGSLNCVILEKDAATFFEIKKRLHYDPGVNPFNGKKTSPADSMRIASPYFSGPYCWNTLLRKQVNRNGAAVLGWGGTRHIWSRTGAVSEIMGDFVDQSHVVQDIPFCDLRKVEIVASMFNISAIVRKFDVLKFLQGQMYLKNPGFESKDGEHINPVASLDSRLPFANINLIAVGKPVFRGPFWSESIDHNDCSTGIAIIGWERDQMVFDLEGDFE